MSNKSWVWHVSFILTLIGSINWGMVGLINLNVVQYFLGDSALTNFIYGFIGMSSLYLLTDYLISLRDTR